MGVFEIYFIGSNEIAQSVSSWLQELVEDFEFRSIIKNFSSLPNGWALVAIAPKFQIAAVDKVRSTPLFYSHSQSLCVVSDSARELRKEINSSQINNQALIEFSMAGYCTGKETLVADLMQLQAGEILMRDPIARTVQATRYYRYIPLPEKVGTLKRWIDELSFTTEQIFKRMIESAGGRQILVPLSGGLDSRLILAMLRQLGYENVRTFSYGPPGNYEARVAKYVAKRLGYQWEFVPTNHASYRRYFWSPARKSYWDFSDGLCTIPNMQDIHPLMQLRECGLNQDVIVVNGQSGDYISGGHIPSILFENQDRGILVGSLLKKHFGLRRSLLTEENIKIVSERIEDSFRMMEIASGRTLSSASLYESWEWQERQCKYVIGGQRIYDWLEMDWRLPLWDATYLEFWSRVPFELKSEQRLYKEYLRSRDFFGLFRDFNPKVWRWPGASMAVLPIAQIVGLLAGGSAKQCFYAYARYIGHYGPNYAPWGARHFLRNASDIRNSVSLIVVEWINETLRKGDLAPPS